MSSSLSSLTDPDARAREEQQSDLLGPPRCVLVTRIGGDDGAHHHHLPLSCECVGVAHARIRSQPSQERADRLDVGFRSLSNWMLSIVVLEQHFAKRAALEVAPLEPFFENIENNKEALGWFARAAFHLLLQPGTRPQLLATAKESKGEVILGGIVAIQGHLRHARARADGVH